MRTDKDWMLTHLAAKLDMDSASLSKIENNKCDFDNKRLEKLAIVFDLEINKLKDELFSEQFAKKKYSNCSPEKALELAKEKVGYYKQLNIKLGSLKL